LWRQSNTVHWLNANLNVANYAYDYKKAGTIFEIKPTMCISLANKGKKQVGWVAIVA
jgi:hypothetical protein